MVRLFRLRLKIGKIDGDDILADSVEMYPLLLLSDSIGRKTRKVKLDDCRKDLSDGRAPEGSGCLNLRSRGPRGRRQNSRRRRGLRLQWMIHPGARIPLVSLFLNVVQ
ncbi:hypothetical protein BGZ47_008347 [Haplosporangium gracile]|nr:hypothetical protein BGZ47_008347 [Haplosporangium gracile]